jgi:hypothetical protein
VLRTILISLTIVVLAPLELVAQIGTLAPAPSPTECAAVESTLVGGSLAAIDSQLVGMNNYGGCGTAGMNAAATAMRRRRAGASDRATTLLFQPFGADTAIMNAAVEMLTDASADSTIRGMSAVILWSYAGGPPGLSYSSLLPNGDGEVCGGPPSPPMQFVWNTLPSDALEFIHTRVASLEHDATQPVTVRAGVNCIANTWRASVGLPMQPLVSYATMPLDVEFICGTRFRITNTSPYMLHVQYQVGPSGAKTSALALGRPSGQSFGSSEYDAHIRGAIVNVWFAGQLVASATPSGAGCP